MKIYVVEYFAVHNKVLVVHLLCSQYGKWIRLALAALCGEQTPNPSVLGPLRRKQQTPMNDRVSVDSRNGGERTNGSVELEDLLLHNWQPICNQLLAKKTPIHFPHNQITNTADGAPSVLRPRNFPLHWHIRGDCRHSSTGSVDFQLQLHGMSSPQWRFSEHGRSSCIVIILCAVAGKLLCRCRSVVQVHYNRESFCCIHSASIIGGYKDT